MKNPRCIDNMLTKFAWQGSEADEVQYSIRLLRVPIHVIMGVSPYSCCVEGKKRRDPPGIPSLNIVVLIAGHIHIVIGWGIPGHGDHPRKCP